MSIFQFEYKYVCKSRIYCMLWWYVHSRSILFPTPSYLKNFYFYSKNILWLWCTNCTVQIAYRPSCCINEHVLMCFHIPVSGRSVSSLVQIKGLLFSKVRQERGQLSSNIASEDSIQDSPKLPLRCCRTVSKPNAEKGKRADHGTQRRRRCVENDWNS